MNYRQVECDEKCPGLDEKVLVLSPEDKHLFRLAKLITLAGCYNLVIRLGLSDTTWNNIQDTDRYDNTVKKYVALCKWKDLKYKQMTKPSFKELYDALAEDDHTHFLCQLFMEDVTIYDIANSALQEIPEDDVLQDLSKEVGNCAIHLGVELGLSMGAIEGILFEYPKSIFKQTLGVMEEWKSSSKVKTTILMLMKAFQSADGRGLMFLMEKYTNMYMDPQSPMMGTSDEIKVDKELLSNGTFMSFDNCVYLAGACNVGKSTLASILIGEKISKHWKSTDGLTIYFGRNGIDLEKKEMVPLKQDFDGNVLSKVLLGKPEKPDTTHREEVLHVPHDSNKGNIIPETHIDTQRTGKDDVNITDPVGQQSPQDYIVTTIQKDIKEEIRKGTYKIEIAPSDLVDFGGQRSFDMTHQLFMRRKGTFVLMFNGRIDFRKKLKEYKQGETTEAILKHWVNSILSYCADDDDDILPIILFCATHSDDFKPEDHKKRKEKLIHDLGEIFNKEKLQHRIIYNDIFFINGQDKNDLEINKLKSKLVKVAFKQKSWGKRKPMACVPLDLQMSELRLHNMSIISKEELITLNKRNEKLALTDEQIKYFLNDQHSLGKIVYFDQRGLDHFINLQPQSLVNILRSFITAKCFWPKDKKLKVILHALTNTGQIAKQDLLKLWSQKKFHQHMPNDDFKEFIIQVLVHLDILVEPKHSRQEKESKVQSYLVPCIVQRRLLNTDFYVKSADKMICLSYTFLKYSLPAALSFKLIGAAMNLWPLKNEGICLYHQAAILCIDKSNDLHLLVKDDRVFVYLINKVAKHFIPSSIASTVQECLTFTMTKVLEFYHKSFGKSLSTLDVSKAFEIKVGEWCTSDGGCYISVPELEKETEWRCKNNKLKRHDKTYPRYWICNKEQVECGENCPGLDDTCLMRHPEDKELFRLANLITLDECKHVVIGLGFSNITWNDIQKEDKYDIPVKKGVALYKWRNQKEEKDSSKPSFQELFNALAKENKQHVLCQLFKKDVTGHEDANSALQEIPENDVLQDLSREVGNCAMHLGVELGLSMTVIEEILFKYRKSIFEQTLGVMEEWKISSKVKTTILVLMKAFTLADGRGLTFLRKKYGKDHKNEAGEKISDDGDGNLQES